MNVITKTALSTRTKIVLGVAVALVAGGLALAAIPILKGGLGALPSIKTENPYGDSLVTVLPGGLRTPELTAPIGKFNAKLPKGYPFLNYAVFQENGSSGLSSGFYSFRMRVLSPNDNTTVLASAPGEKSGNIIKFRFSDASLPTGVFLPMEVQAIIMGGLSEPARGRLTLTDMSSLKVNDVTMPGALLGSNLDLQKYEVSDENAAQDTITWSASATPSSAALSQGSKDASIGSVTVRRSGGSDTLTLKKVTLDGPLVARAFSSLRVYNAVDNSFLGSSTSENVSIIPMIPTGRLGLPGDTDIKLEIRGDVKEDAPSVSTDGSDFHLAFSLVADAGEGKTEESGELVKLRFGIQEAAAPLPDPAPDPTVKLKKIPAKPNELMFEVENAIQCVYANTGGDTTWDKTESITSSPYSGSATISPPFKTTSYTLTCKNADGKEASGSVEIVPPAPWVKLEKVEKKSLTALRYLLNATVRNATECQFIGGDPLWSRPNPVSITQSPYIENFPVDPPLKTTTYTLRCENGDEVSAVGDVTFVPPDPFVAIQQAGLTQAGSSLALNVQVKHSSECTYANNDADTLWQKTEQVPFPYDYSASRPIYPIRTTTYTLVCRNGDGKEKSAQRTVEAQKPIVKLTYEEGKKRLRLSVDYATQCILRNNGNDKLWNGEIKLGVHPYVEVFSINPTGLTTYSATCSNGEKETLSLIKVVPPKKFR